MHRLRALTLGIALGGLVLSACGGGAAPAPPANAPAPPTGGARPATALATAGPTASAPTASAQPSAPETVKMGLPSATATFAPFFIATEKGYFAEEGLAVELITSSGNASTAALITGDLQFSGSAASAVSAALKGADLKVVYTAADRPLSELWSSQPDVRRLEDLRGRPVGVQSRGDSTELALRIALAQRGIDPTSLTYLAVGVGGQRLAAIQAGAVAAATLLTTEVVELQEALPEAHRVADFREEVRMLYGGVAAGGREVREHRERTRRFLRAVMKAREYYKAFREETIPILMQYNQAPRSANEVSYDATLSTMDGDASMPLEIQRRDAAARAQLNDIEQYPPPEQLYDYSLVQAVYRELQARGWRPTR